MTRCFRRLAPASKINISPVNLMDGEEYCNLMLTLIHQTIRMLDKMIDKVKEDFIKNGGIKEQMYRTRVDYRSKNR